MQVIGNAKLRCENFNGVSEKLKKELIKPLEPGEVVHFQLLNGSYDVTLKRDVFGAARSLRLRDRIKDPYAVNEKGEEVGAFVEIGVPDSIVNGMVQKCKKHWIHSLANGLPGNGQFDLSGDSIDELEIYEFLCLANGNNDNPYRGKSKAADYEIIYPDKVAKAQNEKDFKELQAKLTRYVKNNPDKAKELTGLLPKNKSETIPA